MADEDQPQATPDQPQEEGAAATEPEGFPEAVELTVEPEEEAHPAEIVEAVIENPDEALVEADPSPSEDVAEESASVEAIETQPLKITSVSQAKAVIEAMLFVAGDPVSVKRLAKAMGDMNADDVRGVLGQLQEEYNREMRGYMIVEVAGGFQLATRPEYAEWVLQLTGQKRRSPLTGAALETLAIIAYKQPITRAEVDAIRGVESGGVVRTLLDLELIEIKGRKEVLGRPQLYGTSEKFLRAFGLNKLEDLPSIQELRERYQIGKRQ